METTSNPVSWSVKIIFVPYICEEKNVLYKLHLPGDDPAVTRLHPQTLGWSRFAIEKGHLTSPSQKGHKELPGNYSILLRFWDQTYD